jgi:hypothetical protein
MALSTRGMVQATKKGRFLAETALLGDLVAADQALAASA